MSNFKCQISNKLKKFIGNWKLEVGNSRASHEVGQALITLLFFTIIAVTIISAAVTMILVNSQSGTKLQLGEEAYQVARGGAENAVLRLLRDPGYSGETLTIGSGTAVITVSGDGSGGNPFVVNSSGTIGNTTRKVQVTATYINNLLSVTSQREVYQ